MGGLISGAFDWLRDPDNRGAVQVIVAVAALGVAWATGLLRWAAARLRRGEAAPPADRPSQTASGGGVNVGGNVGGNVTVRPDRKP